MKARTVEGAFKDKRLLDAREASIYTSMGRHGCRAFCEQIGAVRRIGGRVLFDRAVIDKALDEMNMTAAVR